MDNILMYSYTKCLLIISDFKGLELYVGCYVKLACHYVILFHYCCSFFAQQSLKVE